MQFSHLYAQVAKDSVTDVSKLLSAYTDNLSEEAKTRYIAKEN